MSSNGGGSSGAPTELGPDLHRHGHGLAPHPQPSRSTTPIRLVELHQTYRLAADDVGQDAICRSDCGANGGNCTLGLHRLLRKRGLGRGLSDEAGAGGLCADWSDGVKETVVDCKQRGRWCSEVKD